MNSVSELEKGLREIKDREKNGKEIEETYTEPKLLLRYKKTFPWRINTLKVNLYTQASISSKKKRCQRRDLFS